MQQEGEPPAKRLCTTAEALDVVMDELTDALGDFNYGQQGGEFPQIEEKYGTLSQNDYTDFRRLGPSIIHTLTDREILYKIIINCIISNYFDRLTNYGINTSDLEHCNEDRIIRIMEISLRRRIPSLSRNYYNTVMSMVNPGKIGELRKYITYIAKKTPFCNTNDPYRVFLYILNQIELMGLSIEYNIMNLNTESVNRYFTFVKMLAIAYDLNIKYNLYDETYFDGNDYLTSVSRTCEEFNSVESFIFAFMYDMDREKLLRDNFISEDENRPTGNIIQEWFEDTIWLLNKVQPHLNNAGQLCNCVRGPLYGFNGIPPPANWPQAQQQQAQNPYNQGEIILPR